LFRNRTTWITSVLLVATGLLGCQLPAAIPCEQDSDCPEGGRCDLERYYCRPASDLMPPPTAGGLEALHHGQLSLSASHITRGSDLPSPVDATRSFLVFTATCDGDAPASCHVTGELLGDGSRVSFSRFSAEDGSTVEVQWTVVQHRDIEVRRGVVHALQGLEPTRASISPPVDAARSFSLSSVRGDGAAFDQGDWFSSVLDGDAELALQAGDITVDTTIVWQVIQLAPDAAVAHGHAVLASGATSLSVQVDAVEPEHCFPLMTSRTDEWTSDWQLPSHAARIELAGSNRLEFQRGEADFDLDLAWDLVSWGAVRAQHGTIQLGDGDHATEQQLERSVDPERSLVLLPAHGRQGSVYSVSDDDIGAVWYIAQFVGGGERIGVMRGANVGDALASFTVLEFQ